MWSRMSVDLSMERAALAVRLALVYLAEMEGKRKRGGYRICLNM